MNESNGAFARLHPITAFAYFLSVLLITMFSVNPVMVAISLAGGILFSASLSAPRAFFRDLLFSLPLYLLLSLTNPLFSHNGVTPLFFLNGNPVTLEAMRAWAKAHPSDHEYDDYIDAHPDFLYGSAIQVLNDILSANGRYSVRMETGDMRIEDLAYVIDLDKQTFEAYKGMNDLPLRDDERFYDGPEPNDRGYYPFRECGVFSLNDLPSVNEFVEVCDNNAYREG